jgi:peptidoglycan hydrolase CwlO-like protein
MGPLPPTHPPLISRSAAALLAAGLAALSLGVAATASAGSPGDLAKARAQLAALTSRIHDAEAQRDALKTQISDLLARIDANRRALEREQPQIETIRSTVTDVTGQVAANQAALDARAAALYEQGPASGLALILNATSFSDFADRLQYVGTVSRSDSDLIASLSAQKAQLEARGTALSASIAALQTTKTSLNQQAAALTAALAQQLATIKTLNQEQVAAQALVDELTPSPTPSPKPTPSPTPPPSGLTVQELVAQDFAPQGQTVVTQAMCVARLESGFNPDAYNPASGASGVFQFIPSTWSALSPAAGWGGASVFDADANVGVAAWTVDQYGWSNWRADTKACGL